MADVMDVLTPEQRRKAMRNIKSSNTKAEIILRKALWHRGIRYRKNYRKLPGTPDIAITRYKIAIFVDGDFWHARRNQKSPGSQIMTNTPYWMKKLARNKERDLEVNDALLECGWLVLRFWESDIKKDLAKCLAEIEKYLPCKRIVTVN